MNSDSPDSFRFNAPQIFSPSEFPDIFVSHCTDGVLYTILPASAYISCPGCNFTRATWRLSP